MKEFVKLFLSIFCLASIFSGCQKENLEIVSERTRLTPIQMKNKALSVINDYQAKMNASITTANSRLNSFAATGKRGAVILKPDGVFEGFINWDEVTGDAGIILTTELGPGDFFRKNPDGSYTISLNTKEAFGGYFNLYDPDAPFYEGAGFSLKMNYSGKLCACGYIPYEDISDSKILNWSGNGKLREIDPVDFIPFGPFYTLEMKYILTAGNAEASFELKFY